MRQPHQIGATPPNRQRLPSAPPCTRHAKLHSLRSLPMLAARLGGPTKPDRRVRVAKQQEAGTGIVIRQSRCPTAMERPSLAADRRGESFARRGYNFSANLPNAAVDFSDSQGERERQSRKSPRETAYLRAKVLVFRHSRAPKSGKHRVLRRLRRAHRGRRLSIARQPFPARFVYPVHLGGCRPVVAIGQRNPIASS